jgi:hypothetical protein
MSDTITQQAEPAIDRVLKKFAVGDPTLFEDMADSIDFRIDHYRDELDVSWQVASNKAEMAELLQRLAVEVFPKGTQALDISTRALGDDWYLTHFEQRYFYAVRQRMVESVTHIISHQQDGRMDFFRETVTNVVNI